jgi:hypothetical protein
VLIPAGLFVFFMAIGALGGGDSDNGTDTVAANSSAPAAVAPAAAPSSDAAADAAKAAADAEAKAKADADAKAKADADAAAKAAADKAAADKAAAEEASKGTTSQQNAYRSAEDYLEFTSFSRKGLLDQLTSDAGAGFPAADAEFAVARLEAEGAVDWNAEAAEAAEGYLEFTSFSRQGLLDQLTSEYGGQFTRAQAEYGVGTTGL